VGGKSPHPFYELRYQEFVFIGEVIPPLNVTGMGKRVQFDKFGC
jgi:hypothetical protein